MGDITTYGEAVAKIKTAILQSRYRAASIANAEQLKLYYGIGRYVSVNTRSGAWGTGAIETISHQLQQELPGLRGFSASNIKNMRVFFETWASVLEANRQLPPGDLPNGGVSPGNLDASLENVEMLLNRQLPTGDLAAKQATAFLNIGFTHHQEILAKCKTFDERWYYIQRCAAEFWSVQTLKSHIRANDYAHYGAIPNNFELTIPDKKQLSRAVRAFKDEYLLDFINIEDSDDAEDIDERFLEQEIVSKIKKFIMAFGDGFCFIGNQYRLVVAEEEFFADLLFFNRNLQCLVAVELKRGKFKPSYLGQLSFYLSALDEQVKKPQENTSIGIVLCKEAKKAVVELAVRDYNRPMGVAVYRTANNIPDNYQTLIPLMEGVQALLQDSENAEDEGE
jgi:predicted nuclease of restriction endonuclease-like (RecB) superfamily